MSFQNTLVLDSRDKTYGTNNNAQFNLSRSITGITKIDLAAITIPATGFIFTNGNQVVDNYSTNIIQNNLIIFNEGGANLTATITPGSYSESLLVTHISAIMTAAGALVYTASIQNTPSITKKLIIEGSGIFTIVNVGQVGVPYKRLGFALQNYLSVNIAGTETVISTYPIDIAPPRVMYVNFGSLNMNTIIEGKSDSITSGNIAALLIADSFEISTFTKNSAYSFTFKQRVDVVSSITVSIYDKDRSYELLNDWVIILTIHTCKNC